jgi:cation-transporting ATPase 13A1
MQIATFAINYEGYPFMEGLRANKPLHRLLLTIGGAILLVTIQALPEFNYKFQLVPLPSEFSQLLLSAMIVDVLSSWLWERVCKWLLY